MSDTIRLGIMGGTFDPIHIGHLIAASEAAARFALDRVLLMPAARPWQKTGYSNAEDRFLMTSLAATNHQAFAVSRLEIDRKGMTYTVDTLGTLKEQHQGARLFLILGADAAAGISTWHEPEGVLSLAELIVVNRPGGSDLSKEIPHHPLRMPMIEVSSTDIRNRVRSEWPIDFLVPDAVAAHIRSSGLYVGTEVEGRDA